MKEFHVHMDKHGRLLVPSQLRNILNYKTGNTFIMRAANDELHVISLEQKLKAAQKLFKERSKMKTSAVDEFLNEKYLEAKKEANKFNKE